MVRFGGRVARLVCIAHISFVLDDNPMGWRLTIGELFPADDLVAQWLYTLTCAAQDIEIAALPLVGRERLEPRTLTFFYRVLIARLYEARRLIWAYNEHAEIREFAADALTISGLDLVALYTRPSGDTMSEVERLYDQSRHRSVHYPEIGSPELRRLLEDYRKFPARLRLDTTQTPPTIDAEWVLIVRGQDVWGAQPWEGDLLEKMRQLSQRTGRISAAWTMASGVLLLKHAHVRGISLDRLTHGNNRLGSDQSGEG
jgi:hypothetical protein